MQTVTNESSNLELAAYLAALRILEGGPCNAVELYVAGWSWGQPWRAISALAVGGLAVFSGGKYWISAKGKRHLRKHPQA